MLKWLTKSEIHSMVLPVLFKILQSEANSSGLAFGENDPSDSTSGFIESAIQCCQTMLTNLNETLTSRKELICNEPLTPIHLQSLFSTGIRVLKPFSICKSVALECHEGNFITSDQAISSGKDLKVLAEEARVNQIFSNLVCNAIQFTPENDLSLRFSYMPFSSTESYWNTAKTPYSDSYVASSIGQQVVAESATSRFTVRLGLGLGLF